MPVMINVAEQAEIMTTPYQRDPGKRCKIWELPPDKQDDARHFYISKGAYRPELEEYPFDEKSKHCRRFQKDWYTNFWWLDYSTHTDSAYCLSCFLFSKKLVGRCGSDTFSVKGFRNRKKVNDGKACVFLTHVGGPHSAHNYSVRCYEDLKTSMAHIDKVIEKQNEKLATDTRLRLKTTIDAMRWLIFQACPFRGHNESAGSKNQGNFLEMVKILASYNKDVALDVLENAPDNNLSVQDIWGQAYDGASNMRGEWNGLKALILRESPYAYYIHCMAHQLQLALVAASREVHELGELDTRRGQNQIGTLQRQGDTRWSSHYKSIQSLKKMFVATVAVLRGIATDRSVSKYSRGDAGGSLKIIVSFGFVFILHLMEKIMKITDALCQKLQYKSLVILNALDSVSNTKILLGEPREHGWESLLEEVISFSVKHEIDIPDLDRKYVDDTTTFHHYKVNVFGVAIDQQLSELNDRFSTQASEHLNLCSSLDPRHESFDIPKISTLAEKFYPADFSSQELAQLESQLDVCNHPEVMTLPSIASLTKGLVKTGKAYSYPMAGCCD